MGYALKPIADAYVPVREWLARLKPDVAIVPMNLCFPHGASGWPVACIPLQVNVIQHPLRPRGVVTNSVRRSAEPFLPMKET